VFYTTAIKLKYAEKKNCLNGQRIFLKKKIQTLLSASQRALGKEFFFKKNSNFGKEFFLKKKFNLCRVLARGHSANNFF